MIGVRKCSMCEKTVGEQHPVTGRSVERLVVNNQLTSYVCYDCVARCVEIMATDAAPDEATSNREQALVDGKVNKDELAIREMHEPVFYSEEGFIAPVRAARYRLAAEARAHKETDEEGGSGA
ncbi:hypothetical protein [Shinella sp. M31]|uniref:hypothetical protein n=1 Tax=Shinella sp. M31 TaxID=3368615 RepID=UPI003BA0D9C7